MLSFMSLNISPKLKSDKSRDKESVGIYPNDDSNADCPDGTSFPVSPPTQNWPLVEKDCENRNDEKRNTINEE